MLRDERRGGGFARKTQVILGLLAVAMLSVAAYIAETRGSAMSLSALEAPFAAEGDTLAPVGSVTPETSPSCSVGPLERLFCPWCTTTSRST